MLNFDLYIALLMTAKMGGCSIGCFGRVLWVDFRTVWGLRPIYRIDMCAHILGSTSMFNMHTHSARGTYGRIRANLKIKASYFGGGGCHRKYYLRENGNCFGDKTFV